MRLRHSGLPVARDTAWQSARMYLTGSAIDVNCTPRSTHEMKAEKCRQALACLFPASLSVVTQSSFSVYAVSFVLLALRRSPACVAALTCHAQGHCPQVCQFSSYIVCLQSDYFVAFLMIMPGADQAISNCQPQRMLLAGAGAVQSWRWGCFQPYA